MKTKTPEEYYDNLFRIAPDVTHESRIKIIQQIQSEARLAQRIDTLNEVLDMLRDGSSLAHGSPFSRFLGQTQ
jgi:hypothetical protein